MHNKLSIVLFLPMLTLAGCQIAAPELTAQAEQVKIDNGEPSSACEFKSRIDASKNNFISNPDEYRNEQTLLNSLKNQAAEIGANTLYNLKRERQNYMSQFYPAPTIMTAEAYDCKSE